MDQQQSAEQSVRLYLRFLEDPESLRDDQKIANARKAVEVADDPVDKLKALADLQHAQVVDGDRPRAEFVRVAKAFAEAEDIPVEAFLELGVPRQDLVDAGFDLPTAGSSRGGDRPARRSRVSSDDVRAAAMAFDELFTINDLVERTGASVGTVRNVVSDLLGEGAVKDAGEDPEWSGRGRSPKRYDNS